MSAGTHPIVAACISGEGPERLVQSVNNWLKTESTQRAVGRPPG